MSSTTVWAILSLSLSLIALSPAATASPPQRPQNVKMVAGERGLLVSWDQPPDVDQGPVEHYNIGYGRSMKSLQYIKVDKNQRSYILEDVVTGVLHFLKMTAENKEGTSKPVYRAGTPLGKIVPSRSERAETSAHRGAGHVMEQRRHPDTSLVEQPRGVDGHLLGLAHDDRRTVSSILMQADQRSPKRRNIASESVYVVSLQAQKALGQSSPIHKDFINKKTHKADLDEMSDVKDITVRVMSPQSVFVSWVDPETTEENADSSSRYYTVRYREKGESARWDYKETTQRRILVENLSADNMYEFSVRISHGDRSSKWSVSVFQRTPESAPTGPPENFNVKPMRGKGTVVTATWEPPEETNGRIREYILSYAPALKPFGAKSVTYRGSSTSAVISGLQPGEHYIFKIRAVNRRGQGPQSKAFSVAMPSENTAAPRSSHPSWSQGLSRTSRPSSRKDMFDSEEKGEEEEEDENEQEPTARTTAPISPTTRRTRPLSQTRSYHSIFSSVRSSIRNGSGSQQSGDGSQTPQRGSPKLRELFEEENEEQEKEKPMVSTRKDDTTISYRERKNSYHHGGTSQESKPVPKETAPEPNSSLGENGSRYPVTGRRKPRVQGRVQKNQRKPDTSPTISQFALPSATGTQLRHNEEEEKMSGEPGPTARAATASHPTTTAPIPSLLNRNSKPSFGGTVPLRQGSKLLSGKNSTLTSVGSQMTVLKQTVASLSDVSDSQGRKDDARVPSTSSYRPVPKSPMAKDTEAGFEYGMTKEAYGKNAKIVTATDKPAISLPALSANNSMERDSFPEGTRAPVAPYYPIIAPDRRLQQPYLTNRQLGSRLPSSSQSLNTHPLTRNPNRRRGKINSSGSKPNYEHKKSGRPNLTSSIGQPVSTFDGNTKPTLGRRFITGSEGLKWVVDVDRGVLMNENGRILQDSQGRPRRVILGEDGRTIFDDQGSPLVNSEGLALFGHGRDTRPVINPKDKFFTLGGKQIVGLDRPTQKMISISTTTTTATTTTMAPTTTPEPKAFHTTTEVITEEPMTTPVFPTCPPGTYSIMDEQGLAVFDDYGILNCYPEEHFGNLAVLSTTTEAPSNQAVLSTTTEAPANQAVLSTTTEASTTPSATTSPNSRPSHEFDAAGKKRFTASYVNYIRKDPGAPCSLTEALEYLQMDVLENLLERDSATDGQPPKNKPHNLTVVAMEGCHSFVILDWARPLKDDMVSGYMVHTASYDDVLKNRWSSRTSTGTHLPVENLKPNSRYYFKVQAKNVFGLGPLSETISYVTESDDPLLIERPPGGEPIWVPFKFKYNPAHSVCRGSQFVKRTWYRKFVGVVLCNSLRYKIFISDGLKDMFYSIGDTFGDGEDHCQFVDSHLAGRTGPQSLSAYLPSAQGYYRAYRQEPVKFGTIGRNTPHNFVGWYECGIPIPGKW